MAVLNLLDVAKLNGSDQVVGIIEEVLTEVPEIEVLPARTITGTSYKTVTRSGLPSAGFRNANEGVTPSKSTFKDELIQMYILDSQIELDKRVADADERGPAHLLGLEATGVAKATLQALVSQMYYGISADAKGFPGLKAFTPFGASQVVNAAGTSAGTASSVFFVRFGEQDVTSLYGNNVTLTLGDWRTQQLTDNAGKKYTGFVNDLGGWAGLQMGNQYCVSRICNLTEDSGKGLTEALIHNTLYTVPVAKKPTHMFLSRRSMKQLRLSMAPSLTLQGATIGSLAVSEMAAKRQIEESTGLTVIVSDSITNTDAIES